MRRISRLIRYAIFLLGRFKWLALFALIAFVCSTWILFIWHPEQRNPETRRALPEVAFGVFELMFASEPALPYPKGSIVSQIVFFALPVLNLLGLAAAVAQFSQILFDRGLYNRAQANHADGHIILCGIGRLGREVLRQLEQRHHLKERRDVVVVENNSGNEVAELELIRQEPIIPLIKGDMGNARTLEEAGIHRAKAVLFLSGDDTANLESAMLARELNPAVRVVLRMDNKYVHRRLDALLRQGQTRSFQLVDSVAGAAPRCVELIGKIESTEKLPYIVVCGLGRLGFGVVRLLKGRAEIVVIDVAERLAYADDPTMVSDPVVPILRGDMTAKWVLQDANIERAHAVLILTPNDTSNLEAAMVIHELNPTARIVVRINNSRVASRLDSVLRQVLGESARVIDPFEHAAPYFVEEISAAYGDG